MSREMFYVIGTRNAGPDVLYLTKCNKWTSLSGDDVQRFETTQEALLGLVKYLASSIHSDYHRYSESLVIRRCRRVEAPSWEIVGGDL